MELNDSDYIGLLPGQYSLECNDTPIKFLSQKENIWFGAAMAIFYPEVMEWDIICAMPTGPTRTVNDIFFKSAIYGDRFSIVDSIHGICEDCEVERFDIRAAATTEQNVYMRAIVKVGNYIPYDYEREFKDSTPTEILRTSVYSENPVKNLWYGEMVKSGSAKFGPLFMVGLGNVDSHYVHLSLQSQDKNRNYRQGHVSVHFSIPVWGGIANDSNRVLASLDSNIRLAAGNIHADAEDIKDEDTFECQFGPYKFSVENAKRGEINKVIARETDDEDEEESNLQIFSVKIRGRINYELGSSSAEK